MSSITFHRVSVIFCTILLLSILQLTQQYTYSCDRNASCGCSSNSASVGRIVGGESAGMSTWSWAVSISIKSNSLCGGAVLSSTWIITAAHCVPGISPSQVIVYAGSNTRFSGQSRTVSRIIVHANYNSTTKVNDIALLQLSSPLLMASSVKSICIPSVNSTTLSSGEWPPAGLYVVTVGWGRLSETGSLPLALQQVTVQTIDYRSSMCRSVLYNRQLQFCAGVPGGGKDTCQGDSGGPIMMYTTSGQWVLVGVTSYGIGCGLPNYAGVYTRVAAYQSWIATTTSNAYTNAISSDSAKINPYRSDSDDTNRASSISSSSSTTLLFVIMLFISRKYTLF